MQSHLRDILGARARKSVAWKLFCGAALASLVLVAAACGDSSTGTTANVDQSSSITDGEATLEVLSTTGASGTANFRLQTP